MRKLILGCLLGLLARVAGAACDSSLSPTSTSRTGLQIPQINSCSWGTVINNNFSILDSSVCLQSANNSFTGTNNFSGLILTSGTAVAAYSLNGSQLATIQNNGTYASGPNKRALEILSQDGIGINGIPLGSGIAGAPSLVIYAGANETFGSFGVIGSSADSTNAYSGFMATAPITTSTLWALPRADGTSGQLLGTDGSTHLGWYNQTSGGSGGSGGTPVTFNQNSVQITSPTLGINMLSPPFLVTSVGGGTTAQIRLDGSSVTLQGPILLQNNYWTKFNSFASSTTLSGNLNISSGILILNDPGLNGQVLTSGGAGTVPAWVSNTAPTAIYNQDTLQSGATFFVSSGTVQGTFSVTGNGNGAIKFTISGSTANVISSTGSYSVGQAAIFSSTNGTVVGGSAGVASGGSGTQWQYRASATSLGGITDSNVWASSVTISTFGVLSNATQSINTGYNGAGGPGLLDVYAGPWTANLSLFCVGSSAQVNQFCVPNNHYPFATLGFQAGQLVVGDTSATGQRIYSNGDTSSYFDLRNGSTATINTGTANGPGDIRFQPASVLVMTIAKSTVTIAGGLVVTGTATIPSIFGSTNASSAYPGMVGEYFSSATLISTNFQATGNYGDLVSTTLAAGDWDLTAVLASQANGATVTTMAVGISTTSGNSSAGLIEGDSMVNALGPTAATDTFATLPEYRVNTTVPTTYYLKFKGAFSVATPQAVGRLTGRRRR